jgi:hypothetical protein
MRRLRTGYWFMNSSTLSSIGNWGYCVFPTSIVRGFLDGGSYEAIPLEVNAYTLGGRFEQNPAGQFSVADEVRNWLAKGRL